MRRSARHFWDRRAEDDAFFFVDDRLTYGDPDLERFWAGGEKDLDTLLGCVDASLEASDRVVEIGCGVGRLTRVIASRCASVKAVDVSERMLALAREHNASATNVRWVLGDGGSLQGIESASADVVISHVVFQHIPDPSITLGYVREIGRVLRPGGWAAFQVSNDPKVHQISRGERVRAGLLALVGREGSTHTHPNWLGSHVELPALEAAAADGSMRIERVFGEGTLFCVVRTRRVGRPADVGYDES
jgi:SAM-dependent methyltransferase